MRLANTDLHDVDHARCRPLGLDLGHIRVRHDSHSTARDSADTVPLTVPDPSTEDASSACIQTSVSKDVHRLKRQPVVVPSVLTL